MKRIILSADCPESVYSVPDEVAAHLNKYCRKFTRWIWENPHGAKLLKNLGGTKCACYGVTDFIDYLNEWVFPDQPSVLIHELDWGEELPAEYENCPYYNF